MRLPMRNVPRIRKRDSLHEKQATIECERCGLVRFIIDGPELLKRGDGFCGHSTSQAFLAVPQRGKIVDLVNEDPLVCAFRWGVWAAAP